MKAIYPWAEMNVGDVRELFPHRSRKAAYSAAWEWAKKHPNEDGSRPKFKVEELRRIVAGYEVVIFRIERTS